MEENYIVAKEIVKKQLQLEAYIFCLKIRLW